MRSRGPSWINIGVLLMIFGGFAFWLMVALSLLDRLAIAITESERDPMNLATSVVLAVVGILGLLIVGPKPK